MIIQQLGCEQLQFHARKSSRRRLECPPARAPHSSCSSAVRKGCSQPCRAPRRRKLPTKNTSLPAMVAHGSQKGLESLLHNKLKKTVFYDLKQMTDILLLVVG